MEAEARSILSQALNVTMGNQNIATIINSRFAQFEMDSMPIPPRQEVRNPPDFGEAGYTVSTSNPTILRSLRENSTPIR